MGRPEWPGNQMEEIMLNGIPTKYQSTRHLGTIAAAVALIGTSLVLLNSGIDEVGNPRLRASRGSARIAGHRIWTTDPTPVLAQLTASRSRLGAFAHSFSRSSLLGKTPAGGDLR